MPTMRNGNALAPHQKVNNSKFTFPIELLYTTNKMSIESLYSPYSPPIVANPILNEPTPCFTTETQLEF